jgi:hypothetical protein
MKKLEIDCVKLQRDIRDRAYRKYRRLTLQEETAEIRKDLKAKGLDHLFPEPKPVKRPAKAAAKRR